MRKLFVMIGLIVMLLFPVFKPQNIVLNASELTTTITTEEVTKEVTEPIIDDVTIDETIDKVKTWVMAFIISIGGSGLVVIIAKLALDRLIKAIKKKIEVAEAKNEISSESASKIYTKLDEFESGAVSKIENLIAVNRELIEQNGELSEKVKALIQDIYARDEVLTELLEDTFLTEVDNGGVSDGSQ